MKSIQKSVLFYLFVAHRQKKTKEKKKIFPNEKNKKYIIYIYIVEKQRKRKTKRLNLYGIVTLL
jgi:hypothetical protein